MDSAPNTEKSQELGCPRGVYKPVRGRDVSKPLCCDNQVGQLLTKVDPRKDVSATSSQRPSLSAAGRSVFSTDAALGSIRSALVWEVERGPLACCNCSSALTRASTFSQAVPSCPEEEQLQKFWRVIIRGAQPSPKLFKRICFSQGLSQASGGALRGFCWALLGFHGIFRVLWVVALRL